jgi:hypothetical protein
MRDRADLLRVDTTGTVHPVGRTASRELRERAGEWRLLPSAREAMVLRRATGDDRVLRLAGEIRTPGAICDVISLVQQSAWTGELAVIDDDRSRSVYFDSGAVVGATTNVADERLGEVLYRFGVVTRSQLDEAVKAANASGKRVGEAAVDLEFVTPEELFPMMARQVEEVFYAALRVGDGLFYFFDRFDEKSIVRRHNFNAGALLMEGARRMDEMHFFREKIPNGTYIPTPIASVKRAPPEELLEILAQCDGKRSIDEIGRRIGQLEFEVTRNVFQLMSGGFVSVTAPRPEGAEAIVEAFNLALADIHRRCDAIGRAGELSEGLSRFATGAGIYDPLFQGAGPQLDGTLRPDRVARNLAALAGDDPDVWLVQQLYEYVGFALFQAGSLLPRDAETALNTSVAELLKPLRQTEGASAPPSRRPP